MTNAQTKLVFGGISDEDAVVLTHELFRSELDLYQVEELLSKPGPTGEFHTETVRGVSRTEVKSLGLTSVETEKFGASSGYSQAYEPMGGVAGGYVEIVGSASGSGTSFSENSGHASGYSESEQEVFIPEYAIMPTALKNPDKVVHEAVVRLRILGQQFSILKKPGSRSVYLRIPTVNDPIVADRTIDKFVSTVLEEDVHSLSRGEALQLIGDRRAGIIKQFQEGSGEEPYSPESFFED